MTAQILDGVALGQQLRAGFKQRADQLAAGELVLGDGRRALAVTGFMARPARTDLAYNLSIDGVHTYHVGDEAILVHNDCGVDPADIHGIERAGLRGIDSEEVWKHGDLLIQDDGQMVKYVAAGDGSFDVVIRSGANAGTSTSMNVSEASFLNRIKTGRWYDHSE